MKKNVLQALSDRLFFRIQGSTVLTLMKLFSGMFDGQRPGEAYNVIEYIAALLLSRHIDISYFVSHLQCSGNRSTS
jgi:hypothetical protein